MSRQFVNTSKEGDSTAHLGNLVQGSVILHSKKDFLLKCVQREPPMFQFVPIAFEPVWAPLKRVWLSLSCILPLGIYTHSWDLSEASFLQAEQPQCTQPVPRQEMLQSFNHPCSPSLDSLQYVHVSHILGSPELDTGLQMVPHQCWLEGQDHMPQPAGSAFPDTAQTLLAAFATRAHCCLIFSLSTRPSLSFSAQLLSGWIAPACTCAFWGLFLPGCRTLDFLRFPLPVSPASWDPSGWPHNCLGSSPPSPLSSLNLVSVHLLPAYRSLVKRKVN